MSGPASGETASGETVPAEHFDGLYAATPDPWEYATSAYEADKYRVSIAALPRARYARGLEVGCSIGVLTAMLAERCDALVAMDASREPLAAARARCAAHGHVEVRHGAFPRDAPAGPFDLAVVSEVGYYLGADDFERARQRLAQNVRPGGHLLLVHWLGSTGGPLTADAVHDAFLDDPRWQPLAAERRAALKPPGFRLDVLERAG